MDAGDMDAGYCRQTVTPLFRSQDITTRVGFRQKHRTCVHFHFLLHCVITIHQQRYRLMDIVPLA